MSMKFSLERDHLFNLDKDNWCLMNKMSISGKLQLRTEKVIKESSQ